MQILPLPPEPATFSRATSVDQGRREGAELDEDLSINSEHDDAEVTVHIAGEIDLSNIARVLAAGREALSSTDRQVLVLDLRAVTFIDSAGVGALVKVVKAAQAEQRTTKVLVRAPSVVRTFTLMGLMRAWDVRAEAAVA
ncbi:STAS domain-containing protein [Quadrisphaera sp. INWT6]|nr:STAS domain-containing protein [Quadrisphaera sp. INWT6]